MSIHKAPPRAGATRRRRLRATARRSMPRRPVTNLAWPVWWSSKTPDSSKSVFRSRANLRHLKGVHLMSEMAGSLAGPQDRSVDSCPLQAVACTWLECLAVRRCPGRRVRRRASTQRPRASNSTQSRCCDTIRSRSDTARATGESTGTPRRHRTAHRHHASAGPRAAVHRLQKRREPTSSTPRIAS